MLKSSRIFTKPIKIVLFMASINESGSTNLAIEHYCPIGLYPLDFFRESIYFLNSSNVIF